MLTWWAPSPPLTKGSYAGSPLRACKMLRSRESVRCLCVFVSFAAGVEWSYGIAVRLALSPKPTVNVPEYFDVSVTPVCVTQYVTTLIAPRHHCPPERNTTGATL